MQKFLKLKSEQIDLDNLYIESINYKFDRIKSQYSALSEIPRVNI
jgi:hypothetical protein